MVVSYPRESVLIVLAFFASWIVMWLEIRHDYSAQVKELQGENNRLERDVVLLNERIEALNDLSDIEKTARAISAVEKSESEWPDSAK